MIETTNAATVITGEHINLYRLLVIRKALEMEIRTGMQMFSHGSALRGVTAITGKNYRGKGAKERGLADINEVIDQLQQLQQ
jgi:hypothetical protein